MSELGEGRGVGGGRVAEASKREIAPTLQEKTIAAIPSGRQQHRVLKMDHPK